MIFSPDLSKALRLTTLSLLCCSLFACSDSPENKRGKRGGSPQLVETSIAEYQSVSVNRTVASTLQAIREVTISNQTQGILEELTVYPGDEVKQGETLARLDDSLTRAELNKAQANLKQARLDLKRLKNLSSRKLASESDIANAVTNKDIAESELQLKKTQLSHTNITAPFDGVVSARLVEPGDVLPLHKQMLSLIDTSSLKSEVHISELLLPLIKVGNSVNISIDALSYLSPGHQSGGNQVFSGEIKRIYPAIDKTTRRGTVEVHLQPVADGARAGQLARITIITSPVERLMIPYDAVRNDKQGSYVYLVIDNKAKRQSVSTGLQHGEQIEILSGLQAGDKIVSKGFFGLKSGKAIKDANEKPAPEKQP